MSRKPLILLALLLAAFAINLDTTIVNVALPTLARELHASNTQLQWVVDAYNLVFAALLLASGSVSDRSGRKGVLLVGLAVFGLASIAGGVTTSPGALIAPVHTEQVRRAPAARRRISAMKTESPSAASRLSPPGTISVSSPVARAWPSARSADSRRPDTPRTRRPPGEATTA